MRSVLLVLLFAGTSTAASRHHSTKPAAPALPAGTSPAPGKSTGVPAVPNPSIAASAPVSSPPAPTAAPTPRPPTQPIKMTLKEALERATSHNSRVLEQLQELRRVQANVEQVRAASMPTLRGGALYTRLDGARVLTGDGSMPPVVLQEADAISANITASVPLIAPQSWLQAMQARRSVGVSELALGTVKRQVVQLVATAYLTIITLRRQVEYNQSARDTALAHARYTWDRLVGGVGSRLDYVRAQQELEGDEQLVLTTCLALSRAQEILGVLVGAEVPVDADGEPQFEAIDLVEAGERAPRLRVDLLELEARRTLARRILRDGWADYMPTLTAAFAPIYTWPATVFTPTWSWQLQLGLTLPIYDGGLRYGIAKERRASVARAAASQEGALRQLRSDLRTGREAVLRTTEALARAHAAAELAHEAVRIADLAYHAGATTNIELIDAERRARDADNAAASAEDAARQAHLELLFAAGRVP